MKTWAGCWKRPQIPAWLRAILVVGIVRRSDPKPCKACAAGEWDMCLNGGYTEHGIKGLDGFARERWRGQPEAMVQLDSGLAEADGDWLRCLVTRRVPLASFAEVFERHP